MVEREAIKMKIQNLFLIIVLLVGTVCCKTVYGQEDKIEYFFSEEVNKAINTRLSSYKEPGYNFYIVVGNILLTEDCGTYQLQIEAYKDTPGEAVKRFIDHSSHYYKNGTLMVPVIFNYDFSFAFFGLDSKGKVIRKNVTGNSYVIEFDKFGKVVKEGF